MKIDIEERMLHFKQPAGTSRGIYTERRIWLVKVIDGERVGIGECAPLPKLSCDDLPDYSEELRVKSEEFATLNSSLNLAKAEFDKFTATDATYIFVTNEIGSGGVSANAVQRKFTDLQGWMNQYIASKADEVILMVSGLPVVIKTDH